MDKNDIATIGKGIGEPIAELADAITLIVDALKNQPNFDRKAFDLEIERLIGEVGSDTIAGKILKRTLG